MVKRFSVVPTRHGFLTEESQDGALVAYSDYATLKEALRECVEVLEKFTCPECKPKNPLCVVTGEPPCEIVSIPKKSREVLGDD